MNKITFTNTYNTKKHRGESFVSYDYLTDEQKEVFDSFIMDLTSNHFDRLERIGRVMEDRQSFIPIFVCFDIRGAYVASTHAVNNAIPLRWKDMEMNFTERGKLLSIMSEIVDEYDKGISNHFSVKVNNGPWLEMARVFTI